MHNRKTLSLTKLVKISQVDNKLQDSNKFNLIQRLLFDDHSIDSDTNTEVPNAAVNYVLTTKRFDERFF